MKNDSKKIESIAEFAIKNGMRFTQEWLESLGELHSQGKKYRTHESLLQIMEDEHHQMYGNVNDVIHEVCPHCQIEVPLQAIFKQQFCPECGYGIVPCSMCDESHYYECSACPISSEKTMSVQRALLVVRKL